MLIYLLYIIKYRVKLQLVELANCYASTSYEGIRVSYVVGEVCRRL